MIRVVLFRLLNLIKPHVDRLCDHRLDCFARYPFEFHSSLGLEVNKGY